jgi:hypothetical protein
MPHFCIQVFAATNQFVIREAPDGEVKSRFPYTAEGHRSAQRFLSVWEYFGEWRERVRAAPPRDPPCRFLLQPIDDVECQLDYDEERLGGLYR